MSGLGIVLEEAELPRPLSQAASPTLAPPFDENDAISKNSAENDPESDVFAEPLLPPLPKGEPFLRSILTLFALLNELPPSSHAHSNSGLTVGDDSALALNDFLLGKLYTSYELDSPSLNIENMPLQFPDPHPSPQNSHSASGAASGAAGATNLPSSGSSPLRRLKSLKMGIRKLSLLKITSPAFLSLLNTSTPAHELLALLPVAKSSFDEIHTSAHARPASSPLQPQQGHDTLLLASSSLRSLTFSGQSGHNGQNLTTSSTTTDSAKNHTLTLGNGRRRTLLNPMLALAALTPPIPSPVITLSENLSHSKKTLSDTEQSFFDNLQTSAAGSEVNLTHSGSRDDQVREKIDSIDKLSTSDELIEYSIFLHEHKKLIEDAFDATKDRLSHSGWCSSNDLENLALQRDSSLSQIDTKLLKIEERLNLRFNLLVLQNGGLVPVASKKSVPKTPSISPSLKVLESRCLSFAMEMGEA